MLFSIIVPAFNAEKYISRSILSVLNQTFTDFELIVVNDGSKDNTLNCIELFKDNRLKLINQSNHGVSNARNTGIVNSLGDYICFLDADDEYMVNHLEHLSNLIAINLDKVFFATRFSLCLRNSNKIIRPNTTGAIEYIENLLEVKQKKSEVIWTGCVCIKRDMFAKYGMFEERLSLGEDTDMWKRIYIHSGVLLSDNVTVKRNRDGSEATKIYTRNFDVDPLNRMSMFMNDLTIKESVKNSLVVENELIKLQVVRSYIFIGNNQTAKQKMKLININIIPKSRVLITYICFYIPSCFIRSYMKIKNRGVYDGAYK